MHTVQQWGRLADAQCTPGGRVMGMQCGYGGASMGCASLGGLAHLAEAHGMNSLTGVARKAFSPWLFESWTALF